MFRKGTVLFRDMEEVIRPDPNPSSSPHLASRGSSEDGESPPTQSTFAVSPKEQESGGLVTEEGSSNKLDTVSNSPALSGCSTDEISTAMVDLRKSKKGRTKRRQKRQVLKEEYIDIIKDDFWDSHPSILA